LKNKNGGGSYPDLLLMKLKMEEGKWSIKSGSAI
jgi:hypothetical protein